MMATRGRLIDFLGSGTINLRRVTYLVRIHTRRLTRAQRVHPGARMKIRRAHVARIITYTRACALLRMAQPRTRDHTRVHLHTYTHTHTLILYTHNR